MAPQKSKHHFIPRGLYGLNEQVNIAVIPHDVHVELHQTMNLRPIELKLRRAWWGLEKPHHNYEWWTSADKIPVVLKIQRRYYERHVYLAHSWLIELHLEKLHEIIDYLAGRPVFRSSDFTDAWRTYEKIFTAYYLEKIRSGC